MKKFIDIISVIILSGIVLALAIVSVVEPDKVFSDKENRVLNSMPKFTYNKLFSGEYTMALGGYIADQFTLRNEFIGVKAYSELAQNKGENNGVIYTQEALIPRPAIDGERIEENLIILDDFVNQNKLTLTVALIPRTADVFSEFLPQTYPTNNNFLIWEKLYSKAEDKGFVLADLYAPLCESNAFYRTDHHYTSQGAFITYTELGKYLGYTPVDEEYFNIEKVTDDFSGTSMRSSGFYLYDKDSIHLYRYKGDDSYSVTADGKEISLYDFSKLNTTDKYAVFLSGNHARVDITSKDEKRERLLIIRDSFADSLAPFLALHFDLTLIDLRYYTDSVAALCEQQGIENVLILESIDELATTKNLSYLRMK